MELPSTFYIHDLSQELQHVIYTIAQQEVLNIPALAESILAANVINHGPHNLLIVLNSLPTHAAARRLAKHLEALPSIQSQEVQSSLSSIPPAHGQELFTEVVNPVRDRAKITAYLMNRTIDIDWQDPLYKRTALIFSAALNFADIVQSLLAAGADPNIQDFSGRTALMAAATPLGLWENDSKLTKLLLAAGANVHIKDQSGRTAFFFAQRHGNTEIVDLLKQAGAKH
jgi:ankyrin repeat protein